MSDPFAASLRRLRREPSGEPPEPPEWLSEAARELWEEILPKLARQRELSDVDAYPIARYCTLLARYQACEEKIAEYGDTFPVHKESEDPQTGEIKKVLVKLVEFPYVRQAAVLAGQLAKAEAGLGIGPANRAKP